MVTNKRCTKCGVEKQLSDFYTHKKGKYGLAARCKPCEIVRAKGWYSRNQKRVSDQKRKWHKDNRAVSIARCQQYAQNNTKKTQVRRNAARVLLQSHKKQPCEECSETFHFAAMQFHHRDPDTKVNAVANLVHSSREILLSEIKKCALLCANCHAMHTTKRFNSQRSTNPDTVRKRKATDRSRAIVNRYKEKPCTDCGNKFFKTAMHFDHLPEYEKTIEISALSARGADEARLLLEMEKCELVCANCHAVRTYNRRNAA